MRIGLVTIIHGQNYGNRLQNYAIQTFLGKKGHVVETIRHQDYIFDKSFKLRQLLKKLSVVGYTKRARRIDTFSKFNKSYIKFSPYFVKSGDIDETISKVYDVFLCGSDQVWNPDYFEEKDSYFLSFVKDKPKIAFSASFGIDNIDDAEKERIKNRLNEMTAISIREESGKRIIKELTEIDAMLVPDPTLLLDAKDWIEIEKKPKFKIENQYALIYLLGHYDRDTVLKFKENLNKKYNQVIFLENEYIHLDISNDKEFAVNPSEFIWLVRNSALFVTDSFHAIIFSLIFKKKFSIIERDTTEGDLSSRIVQLIEMFNIKNPYCEWAVEKISETEVDSALVEKVISEQKAKTENYWKRVSETE